MYNNKFFETERDAKIFQKEHGGRLLHITARSKHDTKMKFFIEMQIAMIERNERVRWTITPWCVAWNEE